MQACSRAQSSVTDLGQPSRRLWAWSLLLALASGACALAGGPSLAAFQGQMLRTSDAGGIDALERMETELTSVRDWVEQNGKPDYVLCESSRSLLLLYIERDQVVQFRRPLFGSSFEADPSTPIRSDHHMRFGNSDKERLARVRMGTGPAAPSEEGPTGRVLRRRVGSPQGGDNSDGRP